MCAAAKAENKKSHIIVPVGVSEIKAKRILDEADLESFNGNDLYEATSAAQHRVADRGHHEEYLSPYAAVPVAAGAGTMMIEAMEDAGEFDYVVVPLGGGGLASGVAAWCSVHSPKPRIIAVQPAVFSRKWSDKDRGTLKSSQCLSQKTAPSQCDGLGVQLLDTTPLADIIDHQLAQVVLVSEDEVTLAMAEALRFQSLALEGSAAAAIAAYHQVSDSLSGKVLLLLTGANVIPSVLARALVQDVDNDSLRRRMGLRNIFDPAERYNAPETSSGNFEDNALALSDSALVIDDADSNVAGLPTTNVREFAKIVSSTAGWESRIVVIDGTMVSGGLPVFDWFVGPHKPLVLYSESASKYAQLGLDIQMGGLVVLPTSIEAEMRKIRRDVGAVMYARGISLLPSLSFDLYQSRVLALSRNAETLCALLTAQIKATTATIAYPAQWKAHGWRHGGAVVTIDFVEKGLNNREGLDACIGLLLSHAQASSLPITKGVSFGFSTARVSASSSMAEGSDPFLRVSVGVERPHVSILASVISRAVNEYARPSPRAPQSIYVCCRRPLAKVGSA